jgi:hypothetical protein
MTIIDQQGGWNYVHPSSASPSFIPLCILYILAAALFFPAAVIKSAVYEMSGSNCILYGDVRVNQRGYVEICILHHLIFKLADVMDAATIPYPQPNSSSPNSRKPPKRAKLERGQIVCPINRFGEITISCWMFFLPSRLRISFLVLLYSSYPNRKTKEKSKLLKAIPHQFHSTLESLLLLGDRDFVRRRGI